MFLNWDLSRFRHDNPRVIDLGRKTTQTKRHSHCMKSKMQIISLASHCWCWPGWWPGWGKSIRFLHCPWFCSYLRCFLVKLCWDKIVHDILMNEKHEFQKRMYTQLKKNACGKHVLFTCSPLILLSSGNMLPNFFWNDQSFILNSWSLCGADHILRFLGWAHDLA